MTFVVGAVGEGNDVVSGARRSADAIVQARRGEGLRTGSFEDGSLCAIHGAPEHLQALVGTAADERFWVLFIGFTFGSPGDAQTAAREVLAYCTGHNGRAQPPKGHYTVVVADRARRELRAYVDHLATAPLYYHEWQGRTYFASELKALLTLGSPRKRWNPDALLQSYLLGFTLDEETVCREVTYLPGGACLVMAAGSPARVERYHAFGDGAETATSLGVFFDRCAEYLEGAVCNVHATFGRLGYAPLATVSGGLDSRAIVAVLGRCRAEDLLTIGWGQPGSADERLGAAISCVVGAKHLSRPYRGGAWMLDVMDEAVSASECMCSYLDAARIKQLLVDGVPAGRGPLYTGLSGDMVMGSFINWRDLLRRRPNTALPGLARRIAVEYTNVSFYGLDDFASLLGGDAVDRVVAAVRDSLEGSLRESESFFNHLDRWNLRNKQARGIFAYFRGAAGHLPVFSPFYDPDLIELVRGMPPRHRFSEAAYVQYLVQRVFDETLAAMPWQKSGTRPRRGLYRNLAVVWGRKVAKKLDPRHPDPFAQRANANPYNLWLAESTDLRERIHDGLAQDGVGAVLQVEEARLRKLLSTWVQDPSAFGAINLNLIYMLSVVRFAQLHGGCLSTS